MCIRDRREEGQQIADKLQKFVSGQIDADLIVKRAALRTVCLLYTSDAADERSSVDLGGRRIINKKNKL